MESVRYETSVVVHRPVEEVWAFLTSPVNLPRWGGAWRGAHLISPGPIEPGATFEGQRVILGVAIRWSGLVTEWAPPRAFAYSVRVLGARSRVRLTLEAIPAGTKVVRAGDREPRPAQKLPALVLGPWLRRRHVARNRDLEQLLEADFGQGSAPPGKAG